MSQCRRNHEHEHGLTIYCYNNGCRCSDCKNGARRYQRRVRARNGRDVHVPAVGSMRRLQALACIGYSAKTLAQQLGTNPTYLSSVRSGERKKVKQSFARKIARLYKTLHMTQSDVRVAGHIKSTARRNGWAPPLAWDNIDDPKATPQNPTVRKR